MFAEQFSFETPALVDFVGAGGKTGLILELMEEYSRHHAVLYTTTTRIHPPQPDLGMIVVSTENRGLLRSVIEKLAESSGDRFWKIVATTSSVGPRLLGGVAPDFPGSLDRKALPVVLNEADGARSMSLKFPRNSEPVLTRGANYLVPVIGIDCLGQPLGPESVFRWNEASVHFSGHRNEVITPELAAAVLMHPQGVCKRWRTGARIIAYINKVEEPAQQNLAGALARSILANENFPVERVVWGSLANHIAGSLPPDANP